MALDNEWPIVPVVISNTSEAFYPLKWWWKGGEVEVQSGYLGGRPGCFLNLFSWLANFVCLQPLSSSGADIDQGTEPRDRFGSNDGKSAPTDAQIHGGHASLEFDYITYSMKRNTALFREISERSGTCVIE